MILLHPDPFTAQEKTQIKLSMAKTYSELNDAYVAALRGSDGEEIIQLRKTLEVTESALQKIRRMWR